MFPVPLTGLKAANVQAAAHDCADLTCSAFLNKNVLLVFFMNSKQTISVLCSLPARGSSGGIAGAEHGATG